MNEKESFEEYKRKAEARHATEIKVLKDKHFMDLRAIKENYDADISAAKYYTRHPWKNLFRLKEKI